MPIQIPRSSPTIKQLRNRCILALSLVTAVVAFSQAFTFLQLKKMDGDAELVNLAGRQRMISQRLPRLIYNAHLAGTANQRALASSSASELRSLFIESQARIQTACRFNSSSDSVDTKAELLKQMTPVFEAIVSDAERLIETPALTPSESELSDAFTALGYRSDTFLPLMDQLVKEIEVESRERLKLSQSIQLASAILIFGLLCFILVFIFAPAMRHIRLAMQQSQQANEAKRNFLANMSHEIRTPMTAILGFTDILLDSVVEQEHVEAARTVKQNGQYLLYLINDILDLSKIESGKLTVERIETSPQHVIADVASLIRVRARSKGLSLEVRYDGPIPETIRCDPTRLRQILINIVGNAIKFTETGSVKIETRLLEADSSSPKLQVDVTDTGIGIPASNIARIFRPFIQANGSTTRKFGGTGLGLSISKQLATLLGGDITVSSEAGKGSTFSIQVGTGSLQGVRLIENLTESAPQSSRSNDTEVSANSLSDCRTLLAEDGPDNQRLIRHILTKAGGDVTVAENGQRAADLALEAQELGRPFDVILMDMQMPVLDGYSASKQLREAGYTRPIIALTAHAMSTDRQKCLNAGCDDYATKPLDRQHLINSIAYWSQRELEQELAESPLY